MKSGLQPILSPHVDIEISHPEDCTENRENGRKLFVLGGRRPDAEWLGDFAAANAFDVWAVDSGAASCRAAGLEVSVMLGDRDSATRDDWSWAVDGGASEHLHDPAKDLTDFQLALNLLLEDENSQPPILTGCFGGRTDHFLSVLDTYVGIASPELQNEKRPRCMIDDNEGLFLVYSGETAVLSFKRRPVAVSLLSMEKKCSGVSISGVRWPLSNIELEKKFPWAISNEIAEDRGNNATAQGDIACRSVSVSCGDGVLAVCWTYCR